MTILKWVLITALAVAFLLLAVANWTPVPFRLPDGTMINIQLPLLLAAAFVAGWLPTWLVMLGTKAQLKRRLARASLGANAGTNGSIPPGTTATATEPRLSPLPAQAQPTIVPPAGA